MTKQTMKTARTNPTPTKSEGLRRNGRLPEVPAAVTRADAGADLSFVIDLAMEIKQAMKNGKALQTHSA